MIRGRTASSTGRRDANSELAIGTKRCDPKSASGQSLPDRASGNSGDVRYTRKRKKLGVFAAAVICLCGLIVTRSMLFPRSELLKDGTVPILAWALSSRCVARTECTLSPC